MINIVRHAYAHVRRFLGDIFFDRPAGIETSSVVRLRDLGLHAEGRQDYHATPWTTIKRALAQEPVRNSDVFVDIGCGKGRVLYQAAMYPFRRVIGVELSPRLADVARENMERARSKLVCTDVEVVSADAVAYEFPDDVTFIFFSDPFHGEMFSTVVRNILASLQRRPREITVIYFDPIEEATLLEAGARLIHNFGGFRPTNEWAQENSVRIYKLGAPPGAGR